MAFTYHELKEKTIKELRDIAKDVPHDAVRGFSQMNKEHLLRPSAARSASTSTITMTSRRSTSPRSRRRCACSSSGATPRSKRTMRTR